MAPAKIPGSSGTRNLADNLSDLKAQIAANNKVCIILSIYNIYLTENSHAEPLWKICGKGQRTKVSISCIFT